MEIHSFNPLDYSVESEYHEGLHLCYIKNEGKERILFIHGATGSVSYFYPLMQDLHKKGYEPWALDLRGHGQSEYTNLNKVHLWDYVEDVKRALSICKAPFLIGHSMGGFISQKVATSHPLKGLILLCSMPPKGIRLKFTKKVYFLLYALISFPYFLVGKKTPFSKLIEKRFAFNRTNPEIYSLLQEEKKRILTTVHKGVENPSPSESPHFLFDVRKQYFGRILPSDISCPIEVIGSEYDLLTHKNVEIKIAQYYQSKYTILPNSGHMPMIEEDRELLGEKILNFMNSIK